MDPQLRALAERAWQWPSGVTVHPGPRGALGRIWRVEHGTVRLALKESWAQPASPAQLDAELGLARAAIQAGVRLPRSHPTVDGRYVVVGPQHRWLRLYDWEELRPAELSAPSLPADLGLLLARLHSSAPAARAESSGAAPDSWYDTVPAPSAWQSLVEASARTVWGSRLAAAVPSIVDLSAIVVPAEPDEMVLCHRDLHPENVLWGAAGELVVVDWDNLGPAVPSRELAAACLDWFCDGCLDAPAVRTLVQSYVDAGGPARPPSLADFTMPVACRLNFLRVQARAALDPATDPDERAWAEQEIAQTLQLLPTRADLDQAVAAVTQRWG